MKFHDIAVVQGILTCLYELQLTYVTGVNREDSDLKLKCFFFQIATYAANGSIVRRSRLVQGRDNFLPAHSLLHENTWTDLEYITLNHANNVTTSQLPIDGNCNIDFFQVVKVFGEDIHCWKAQHLYHHSPSITTDDAHSTVFEACQKELNEMMANPYCNVGNNFQVQADLTF